MEYFSCKDGYGIRLSGCLKAELACAIDKWFQFINKLYHLKNNAVTILHVLLGSP